MSKNLWINILIYFYWRNGTNTNNIWGPFYLNIQGRDLIIWPEGQWEAGIWSCDLRANERPQKNLHGNGTLNRHTHTHTDSVTTRPTRPRGPSWWKISSYRMFKKLIRLLKKINNEVVLFCKLFVILTFYLSYFFHTFDIAMP